MVQPESRPTRTEFEPARPSLIDPNGVGHTLAWNAQRDDLEEEAMRGVVAIDIPREVIARFSGTLILSQLPERRPEIVFDRGPQFRDDDEDE